MFFFRTNANTPHVVDSRRVGDAEPQLDDRTGNPGLDGYTRMSIADRATGQRPTVARPVMFPARPYED